MNQKRACPSETVLTKLLEESLDEAELQLFNEHIEHCPTCQQKLDRLTVVMETSTDGLTKSTLSKSERVVLDDLVNRLCEQPPSEIERPRQQSELSTENDNWGEATFSSPRAGQIGR